MGIEKLLQDFKGMSYQISKADYLESQGFEFYEIDKGKYKPFGWRRGNVKFSSDKIIKLRVEQIREIVEKVNREELMSKTKIAAEKIKNWLKNAPEALMPYIIGELLRQYGRYGLADLVEAGWNWRGECEEDH
ncbi:MAG: hypothetical protein PHD54_14350 [Desulfuromonadaceae bacterium]|nr:hypothetical protein [Desulfuromonadaceae bacterium]